MDSNKSGWQKTWELISRHTWQLPQTKLGFLYAHASNMIGNVTQIRHLYGTTVLRQNAGWMMSDGGGATLSNFIVGGKNLDFNADDEIFQHEYGHYIQSQKYGWAYLTSIALPSAIYAKNHNEWYSMRQPYELDASLNAKNYFTEYIPEYNGWNNDENPFTSDINSPKVSDKWYNYLIGIQFTPFSPYWLAPNPSAYRINTLMIIL